MYPLIADPDADCCQNICKGSIYEVFKCLLWNKYRKNTYFMFRVLVVPPLHHVLFITETVTRMLSVLVIWSVDLITVLIIGQGLRVHLIVVLNLDSNNILSEIKTTFLLLSSIRFKFKLLFMTTLPKILYVATALCSQKRRISAEKCNSFQKWQDHYLLFQTWTLSYLHPLPLHNKVVIVSES